MNYVGGSYTYVQLEFASAGDNLIRFWTMGLPSEDFEPRRGLIVHLILGQLFLMNYVCGSYIYVQLEFASRLKVLESSWNTANDEGS